MNVMAWALLAAVDLPVSLKDAGGEGPYSFGFRAGVAHLPDADDTTWTAALAFRGRLGSALAVELSGAYYPTEFDDGRVEEEVVALQASLLLYPFPTADVRPYFLAGPGVLYVDTEFEDDVLSDADDFELGVQVGAGVDVELGRGAYLSADARWNFYDHSDHLESEDLDFLQITVGIHFRIG